MTISLNGKSMLIMHEYTIREKKEAHRLKNRANPGRYYLTKQILDFSFFSPFLNYEFYPMFRSLVYNHYKNKIYRKK